MAARRPSRNDFKAAYQEALARYHGRPEVTGIDVGFKYKGRKRTRTRAVRIHLREKIQTEHVHPKDLVPPTLGPVPTDVIQASYQPRAGEALQPARMRPAPAVQPGISIGHHRLGKAGTLGAVVYCRRTGRPCLLSNWHILAGAAAAVPNDPILQPAPPDGGRVDLHTIGRLDRWLINADGDAAIAVYEGVRPLLAEQFGSGAVLTSARMPEPGEVLVKSGRTTGITRGKVAGLGQYVVDYHFGPLWISGFIVKPEIEANPADIELSSDGDSGAVWYSKPDLRGVGLQVAGEMTPVPSAEHAIACFLPVVLERLDVSLTAPASPQGTPLPGTAFEISQQAPPGFLDGPGLTQAFAEWLGANRGQLDALASLAASSGAVGPAARQVYESYDGRFTISASREPESRAVRMEIGIRC